MFAVRMLVERLLGQTFTQGRHWAAWGVAAVMICGQPPVTIAGLAGQHLVASGLSQPVFATHAPGDASRLFIVERDGAIRILNLTTGALQTSPFLTIAGVDDEGEGGFLGLAFHPDYATNRKFYTYTTHDNGGVNVGGASSPFSTHIRQYTASEANPNIANPTFTPVINFARPQSNHVGGWIGFGPDDGYLYVANGDGGGSDDNDAGHTAGMGNAQDKTSIFGKMLRIDVDVDDFPGNTPVALANNYGEPGTNPFVGFLGDDRVWSYGLRNPFRASFDRATGDLWIGDVGQDTREEIDFQQANSGGGENYGWRLREGFVATPTPDEAPVGGLKPAGNVDPVYDYPRTGALGGITVIGGYVYRGPDPTLRGVYFFGDAGVPGGPDTVKIWTFDPTNPTGTVLNRGAVLLKDSGSGTRLASFGEDALGNLYTVYLQSGEVYRIVTDATSPPGDFSGDGDVDRADLALWRAGFRITSGAMTEDGDANGDGDVDGNDFLVWQRNVTLSTPGSLGVPEPMGQAGALAVALVVVYGVGDRRRGLSRRDRRR